MAEEKKNARRAARETVFALLYETEFHEETTAEAIYALAVENREIDPENAYIRDVYFGVMANIEAVDALIGRHAKGWKTNRLSRVSRAVLRLGAYELAFVEDVPAPVAINEAVELSKKFDDPKARAFINGVLNAVKNELAEGVKHEENE
jgi:N utilization substance protein B